MSRKKKSKIEKQNKLQEIYNSIKEFSNTEEGILKNYIEGCTPGDFNSSPTSKEKFRNLKIELNKEYIFNGECFRVQYDYPDEICMKGNYSFSKDLDSLKNISNYHGDVYILKYNVKNSIDIWKFIDFKNYNNICERFRKEGEIVVNLDSDVISKSVIKTNFDDFKRGKVCQI